MGGPRSPIALQSLSDENCQRKAVCEKDGLMTLRAIALAISAALMVGTAAAQERPEAFPTRPVKIVVPFPAGGPTDILARVITQRLSEVWGQPVVVENQPGANTAIAAARVAKNAARRLHPTGGNGCHTGA